jgi:general secretion pathway protein G
METRMKPEQTDQTTRAGFTLVEILVVMAIIAILVGITIGVAGAVSSGSAEAKAKAEIGQLQIEIDLYKADRGTYPSTRVVSGLPTVDSGLYDWFEGKYGADRIYETTEVDPNGNYPVDPWGNPYIYIYQPANPFVFTIGSLGPDGVLRDAAGDVVPNTVDNVFDHFGNGDDLSSRKGI